MNGSKEREMETVEVEGPVTGEEGEVTPKEQDIERRREEKVEDNSDQVEAFICKAEDAAALRDAKGRVAFECGHGEDHVMVLFYKDDASRLSLQELGDIASEISAEDWEPEERKGPKPENLRDYETLRKDGADPTPQSRGSDGRFSDEGKSKKADAKQADTSRRGPPSTE